MRSRNPIYKSPGDARCTLVKPKRASALFLHGCVDALGGNPRKELFVRFRAPKNTKEMQGSVRAERHLISREEEYSRLGKCSDSQMSPSPYRTFHFLGVLGARSRTNDSFREFPPKASTQPCKNIADPRFGFTRVHRATPGDF